MTPEQLKASLLQFAMKGKITEQLSSDGSASDLLPLLNIDSKIKANDPPFDIPDNWLWIPIGNLGETTGTDSFSDGPFGSNLKTVHYINEPEVRIIQLSNIGEDGWKDKNVKYTSYKHLEEVIPRCEVHPGDFVIAKMMPAGRTIEVPDLGTRITLGSDAMKFVPNKKLNKKFLLWAMHSQAFLEQVYSEAHGITRVRTTLNGVKSYVLPIPPLEEQHRIVAKIEELLPYVDRYAEAYEKLEQFNAKFPEDMKKSILQYAIQGKLVEQRPEEGTAEELYQRIQEDKKTRLGGKKEAKLSSESFKDDEIPYEIPDTWKWVRFGHIMINRDAERIPLSVSERQKLQKTYDYYGASGVIDKVDRYLFDETLLLIGEDGANLLSRSTPIAFLAEGKYWVNNHAHVLDCNKELLDIEFIMYYINAITLAPFVTGTAQPKMNQEKMNSIPIALPPYEEQKRIVKKIKELLPYCDKLKK